MHFVTIMGAKINFIEKGYKDILPDYNNFSEQFLFIYFLSKIYWCIVLMLWLVDVK